MKVVPLSVVAAGASLAVFGAGLTSQSYVQDGLVAQLDAIENVGVGQAHDATATVWKDLKGSASLTLLSGAAWGERTLDLSTVSHTISSMPEFYTDSCSTEVAMNLVAGNPSDYRRIFTVNIKAEDRYNVYFNPNTCNAFLFINAKDTRPSFGAVTWGTLATSCATNFCDVYNNAPGYGSGIRPGTLGATAGHVHVPVCDWAIQKYPTTGSGIIHGQYCAFRHYTRPLEQDELARNGLIDRLRFFSFVYRGSGASVNWAEAQWTKPTQTTATAPAAGFKDYATVGNVTLAVSAADTVELAGLSIEDGATLAVAANGAVSVKQLFVEGVWLPRGIYTAVSTNGTTAASWITGAGEVRVTGESATRIPKAVAGLGPFSYVQEGMIAQFDAVDNEGTGVHNASATVWRDLAGSASVTLSGTANWIDRALDTDGCQQTITGMPMFCCDSVFTELAVKILSHKGSYPRLFYHSGDDSRYCVFHQYGGTSDNTEMHYWLYNSASRPSVYFSDGTLELGSDRTNIRTYANGMAGANSESYHLDRGTLASANWYLDKDGNLHSHFRSLRHYNRALTKAEIAHNRQIDIQRFESYLFTGDGTAINWSDIVWLKPERGGTGDAPSGATNEYATVANAIVQVSASDTVALRGLSLEQGAKLALAEGAKVDLKLLYQDGVEVARGVYTADGHGGTTKVSWLTGDGEMRVAGGLDRGVPSIPVADADGWYTFGLLGGSNQTSGYTVTFVGEYLDCDNYIFPSGAKLRLRGYVLFKTVPDIFADYDTTQLKHAIVNGTRAYAANRPFEVPTDAGFRFLPGTWTKLSDNTYQITSGTISASQMQQTTGDVTLSGTAKFILDGDIGINLAYSGLLAGDGKLYIMSYGRQMRFTGGFACNAGGDGTWQNGTGFWVDTLAVTSSLQTITLGGCTDSYGMTTTYSASYVMFGKNASDATADHPLHIATLNGNASSRVDSAGKRWRSGGHALVWGSNTLHVGKLNSGLHVVASRRDQHCDNGFLNAGSYTSKGIGFIAVDDFKSGTIFGSTNIALTVGSVASGAGFDYTYQSNDVNRLTLDITNGCNAATTVKATDLAMLPARLSGFTGKVYLTETATRSYEMPIDFTVGPEGLYNTVGCNGSGELAQAPAAGTINVTFPTTGITPVKGKYALARFTSGGEKLSGWTVTLNGKATADATIDGHTVTLRRTDKGLSLGVDLPGLMIILK